MVLYRKFHILTCKHRKVLNLVMLCQKKGFRLLKIQSVDQSDVNECTKLYKSEEVVIQFVSIH